MLRDRTAALENDMLDRLAHAFNDDPRTWAQCKEVLRNHKFIRDVEHRVKALAREFAQIPSIGGPPQTERSVSEIWDGAPVGKDVYPPQGYEISMANPAIERLQPCTVGDAHYEKRIPVCRTPMLITRRIGHVQMKSLMLEIAYRTDHGWRKLLEDRAVLFNARKIVDTSRFGVPVASDNAMELVTWLRHYEGANSKHIPEGHVSSAMGWQGSDDRPTQHGFLCGTRQLGGNGRAIELEGSDGDMAEAKQFRVHGSFDTWKAVLEGIVHFPAVRLAICAALAPPLIAILGAPNGIVEWSGRTSQGKTTVLKIAQSCWRSGTYDMSTWDATTISVEAAAKFQSDLPLIIDDTKTAGDASRGGITKVIYQLIAGRARGRANRDGAQRLRGRWRTLAMITGEEPVGEIAKAEGAAARVLSFWSAPFGEISETTGRLIDYSVDQLGLHYGHAGPKVVRWLWDNQDAWDDLRTMYIESTNRVRRQLATPAAARLSEVIALLDCSAYVGMRAGCMPWMEKPLWEYPEVNEAIRRALTLASSSSDRAYDAWEYAISEALSKPKSWIPWGESPPDKERDPSGGWLGYYAIDSADRVGEHAWFPQQLRKVLTAGGFDPGSAMRAWKDLGVLINPERSRFTSQVRPELSRQKMRLIRVKDQYPGHEIEDD